jgi:hypothetical protein
MGPDYKRIIKELIENVRGFNNDPKIIDQRVKAIVITKLEEASLWFDKLTPPEKSNA